MKRKIVLQLVVVLCLSVGGLIAQEGKVSVEKVAENVYLYTYENPGGFTDRVTRSGGPGWTRPLSAWKKPMRRETAV